jgi:hypothetical protein
MEIAVLAGIWLTGRCSQKAAVSAPAALHIFDRRISKESFTSFRSDANERVIEGMQYQSRNGYTSDNFAAGSAEIIIISPLKSAIWSYDAFIEIPYRAN